MTTVEKDPKKTRRLAAKLENENWAFRAWLKYHAPRNIDQVVSGLSRKSFALIDCKECGNCCRSMSGVPVRKSEIAAMAETKQISCSDFKARYIDPHPSSKERPWCLKQPCPMLDGNLCSVYSARPETCKKYPYLEEPGFTSRLIKVIDNTFICPIVFNVFEELKTILNWR
jgi:uncharacterized protein